MSTFQPKYSGISKCPKERTSRKQPVLEKLFNTSNPFALLVFECLRLEWKMSLYNVRASIHTSHIPLSLNSFMAMHPRHAANLALARGQMQRWKFGQFGIILVRLQMPSGPGGKQF